MCFHFQTSSTHPKTHTSQPHDLDNPKHPHLYQTPHEQTNREISSFPTSCSLPLLAGVVLRGKGKGGSGKPSTLWLSCLVLSAAYKSSLAAHFTVGVKAPPVDSFVDLVARGNWRWGSEPLGGASLFYFTSSIDATTRAVYAKMEVRSDPSVYRLKGGVSCAFLEPNLVPYQVASRYTDPRGYTPIHTGATHYPKFAGTSWGFRIGAPCLPAITVMTQRLIEGGLIRYWLADAIATRVREERRTGSTYSQALAEHWTFPSESEGDEEVVVTMTHLYAAFYIWAAGLALSCLAFSGEILLARFCCRAYRLRNHIRA
ncbi:hypothetical protein O3P69_000293 [Scylla paramamosain]|uniref:Uncharacterized protein n=1 Tax=Scylla paramamosain TaxID=85552 RepID=A0AAW0UWR0_SCYPA